MKKSFLFAGVGLVALVGIVYIKFGTITTHIDPASQTSMALSASNVHPNPKPIGVNGQCGSATNGHFITAPTTGLCTTGTVANMHAGYNPSAYTTLPGSYYHWSCTGSGAGVDDPCGADAGVVYDQPGTYTFTIPTGVKSMTVDLWGAGGNGISGIIGRFGGGSGMHVTQTINILPANNPSAGYHIGNTVRIHIASPVDSSIGFPSSMVDMISSNISPLSANFIPTLIAVSGEATKDDYSGGQGGKLSLFNNTYYTITNSGASSINGYDSNFVAWNAGNHFGYNPKNAGGYGPTTAGGYTQGQLHGKGGYVRDTGGNLQPAEPGYASILFNY